VRRCRYAARGLLFCTANARREIAVPDTAGASDHAIWSWPRPEHRRGPSTSNRRTSGASGPLSLLWTGKKHR